MSKGQEIKKKIQEAIDVVKNFDEPYRTKAFEVILSQSLESDKKTYPIKKPPPVDKKLNVNEKIEKFAQKVGITIDQLENVFEFSEDGIKFVAPLTGSTPQKQAEIAQCVLICLEEIYRKKSVLASELKKIVDDTGVDTKNLSRSLMNNSNLFRKFGKLTGTKYRLTDVGKNSSIELIRTLATSISQS